MEAIYRRRSIRNFSETPINDGTLTILLQAAVQAPSGKNKQPWKFIVVKGDTRNEMNRIMKEGIAKRKASERDVGGSEYSVKVMEQAPTTIFIINPKGIPPWEEHTTEQMFDDVVDIQSIGAAIQNLILAATDLGIGTLWICDVFYAYEELMNWLGESGEMIAAVALGYSTEKPNARPRKPILEVVRIK
jgi:nitroreductase